MSKNRTNKKKIVNKQQIANEDIFFGKRERNENVCICVWKGAKSTA